LHNVGVIQWGLIVVSVAEQIPDKLEIGDVFGTVFGVISRNLVLCLLLGGLLHGLPTGLYFYWLFNSLLPLLALSPSEIPGSVLVWLFATPVILYVLGCVLQAALVRVVIADYSGKQASFGECLATGFAVILPLMGMSFFVGLGVLLGLLLFIVPGVMLSLRWFVSVPVLVHQRTGPLASMSRSAFLTYGSRWRLFWVLVIGLIAAAVLQFVVEKFGGLTTGWLPFYSYVIILAVASIVISTMLTIVTCVLSAVCYVGLRVIKEDIGVDELAQAFS